MSNRKMQFQQDWLASNWDKFVAGGIEDSHGRLLTVSDALELTSLEGNQIDAAFRLGAFATHEAIEIIAKAFLLDVVVDTLWDEHLAAEEEMGRQMLWARAEQAFENHDLKESAR
ncbi:hypothetical protein [Aeromonas phage 51]|uniref:Uncharacterized protein n=3 Tax=Popoffvirus pv56 TaxID=2560283 RepID=A0A219YBA5_9CAUD|nr:hypothetical protein F394_gp19 [Aeromonas phage vB_AsaM-56]AFC22615.1 hypothetical protein AsaM-56_0019 [Aeromonas phage vB_AsaM-56]APU01242.1 hypothetical protein [Aeromonas phage 51]APU01326.1 hypothetical protein [Aeromonas phage 56]